MINMDAAEARTAAPSVRTAFTERLPSRGTRGARRGGKGIDAVSEKGECDFVTEIAAPFPIRIICEMMGIPESQHAFVFEQTNIILGLGDPEYTPDATDLAATLLGSGAALAELMRDLRKQRLERPTEDLTSVLVQAEIDGDRLTEQEMGSFFILLVAAGNETTRNASSRHEGAHRFPISAASGRPTRGRCPTAVEGSSAGRRSSSCVA
jgi:cytochrome P450